MKSGVCPATVRIPGLSYYVTSNVVIDRALGRAASVGLGSEQSIPVPGTLLPRSLDNDERQPAAADQ